MKNILEAWYEESKENLNGLNNDVSIEYGVDKSSTSVNVDNNEYVSSICFWEPNVFEFQFLDYETEEVVFLDTVELNSIISITKFYNETVSDLKKKNR